MSADNIVMNSCQYTPVYFIEDPGVSQARSYFIAPNDQNADKPVSESLKRFYENSGKLESNLTVADNSFKPKNIKKNDTNVVGNNLKLASFLLPKCETKNELCQPMLTPVNNVLLKPVYISNNLNVNSVSSQNPVPKIDVNSRLVKLKDLPNIVRSQNGKILPKIKPKENCPSNKQKQITMQAVPPVQLVKFGETYHSLNQLSNDQMKIVNHALKMFNNAQASPPEAAYDPATHTKFIYKVVSQKDFVERNKLNKQITAEIKKEPIKLEQPEVMEEDEPKMAVEAKVTRSGRVVKLPKNIIVDDSPTKPKRRPTSIVSCLQCNSKFSSPQRLHRHYENHPSHLPTNLHNNLFHCLIAIVTAGSESERAGILVQQLEQLVEKLKSCVPCLLKCDGVKDNISLISNDISKLFGINPGKYNFNMDALGCEKDKDGYCSHNPRPLITVTDNIKPHIILENIKNSVSKGPSNILKVNFQDRRPKILRKVEYRKQKLEQSSHNVNGKKMKLSEDKNSNSLEIDDLVALLSDTAKTENKESKVIDEVMLNDQKEITLDTVAETSEKVPKPPHIQFHSAHFDIRSSPIKPTSTVFRKFQINPEKMTKYIEIIRPIQLNQLAQDVEIADNTSNIDTQEIFSDNNIISSKESETDTTKNWCQEPTDFMNPNNLMHAHMDNFMKPNAVVEPALLHVKNSPTANNQVANELVHVENDSKVATKHNDLADFMKSDIFTKELLQVENDSRINKDTNSTDFMKELIHVDTTCQLNKVNNRPDFMKCNISIEPLLLAQDNHKITNKITDQVDDFMKTDVLIDQSLPLLDTQECNISDSNDYMKSNISIEPALIHNQDAKVDKFADQTHSFMMSNGFIDPTLPHSNNVDRVTDVTENNEIDITSQGQSIMSFLESLGNELAYTETDNRNNPVDFQLDLFSFNNS
ncbi:jg18251 [Pararge aegeria aegeria]|uniref:Jg18251 protein n=1 Tax=Pararge aegeria aegeria TaxID=348720 RepID=A0A8S4SFF1_9NEOP|nr:jg18251 [Pararge aegeria aegeria]